ncbi:MAG: hypothetical protein Q8P10_01220 [bacterium]|nr:hypothetical protein [bacterium]
MNTLSDPFFWVNFLYFFLAVFIAFFIPGDLLIRRLNLSSFNRITIATLLGLVMWGWQGYVFGYLGIRWATYPYLLLCFVVWVIFNRNVGKYIRINKKVNFRQVDFLAVLLITIGIFMQLSSVWLNGVLTSRGLYFCCGSIMDNILFLSITDQIAKNFPPFEPGMYGVNIQNYHYWGSLVVGELIRVFKLPLLATSYQYMTVFVSLFLGASAITFTSILKLKRAFAIFLIFFLYFGGDFIWVVLGVLRGNSFFAMNPMESGQQFLENIPRAIGVIEFFAFISVFIIWIRKKDIFSGIVSAFIVSSLIGFKIYIGFFALSGLGILACYYLIKHKLKMVLPIMLAFILSLFIYYPVNSNAGGLYYTGFWRFENFIVQPLFNLQRLELARVIYLTHNNWLRVIQYEIIFMFIYFVSTFGTKLVGLFQSKKSLASFPKEFNILMISAIILSIILGSFFLQASGGANTFNFLVSVFILGSIYTALSCYYFISPGKKFFPVAIVVLIILLTIPRVIYQTGKNILDIKKQGGFIISNEELQALNFLREQKDTKSLVIVDPEFEMEEQASYVSFLTNKNMFLSAMYNELEAHNIDFSKRLKVRKLILNYESPILVGKYLLKNNIGYIYMSRGKDLVSTRSAYFVKEAFKNKEVKILTLDKNAAIKYIKRYEYNN